ncbi:T9SS type B sorting domain-containing protein [Bizionia gelidisalsuginis]|nr:gliding motility-associated C-terminal domain-containing protein [Bizionia gelidisalsuginis]
MDESKSINANFGSANASPTISNISNITDCPETAIVGPLNFTIGDIESNSSDLIVSATSSNISLIPNANISLGGSDENRVITLTPNSNESGTSTITVKVTDEEGAMTSTTFNVTLADSIIPTLTAVDNITENVDASCEFSIPEYSGLTTATDNCGTATLSQSPTVGTVISGYNTVQTITLTADDGNGNTNTTTFDVTLADSIIPTLTAVDNITENVDASCEFSIPEYSGLTTATDNCGTATLSQSPTVGTVISGHNTVQTITLTADEGNGNTNTTTFDVTLADVTAPTAVTQNITVQLNAAGTTTITPQQINNVSTDACGIESFSLDITSFSCENIGGNTVTLTVTDFNGNSDTATAIVTVEDTVAPSIITQDIVVELDENGVASITPSQIDNVSTDNCGIATYLLDIYDFSCVNLGSNTVTLTITDINGNESQATATVQVEDNIAPIALAITPFTIQLDEEGTAIFINADTIDNGSTDNCSIASMTIDLDTFTCDNLGDNTVTLTVIDSSGNSSIAETIITVEDNILPVLFTQDLTIELDENGLGSVIAEEFIVESYDNCSISSLIIDQSNFDCADLGDYSINLTATDSSGNVYTEIVILTVTGSDFDGDLIADSCDFDDDNDGILDYNDSSPFVSEPLIVPAEAFTPNGDNINDLWLIPGIDSYTNSIVKVYNKWGHEVYASKGYKNDWNGIYKSNSEKVPPGSYLYIIDLGNGSAILQGWIFINY